MDTFDFILDDDTIPIDADKEPPKYAGTNLATIAKMTRKKVAQDILDVYQTIGGATWLYTQAMADPKAFFDLIKKIIPNPTVGDALADITVKLINMYGERMEISTSSSQHAIADHTDDSASATSEQRSGQPEIATGGTPIPPTLPKIIETFGGDNE